MFFYISYTLLADLKHSKTMKTPRLGKDSQMGHMHFNVPVYIFVCQGNITKECKGKSITGSVRYGVYQYQINYMQMDDNTSNYWHFKWRGI